MSYCMDFEAWFNENRMDIEEDFLDEHKEAVEDIARKQFDKDPNFYVTDN